MNANTRCYIACLLFTYIATGCAAAGGQPGFQSGVQSSGVKSSEVRTTAVVPNPAIELPELVTIEAGTFIKGSDQREREIAYQLDEKAYGHQLTRERKWYDSEPDRQTATTDRFDISVHLVTNAQYAEFISQTSHPTPYVDASTWQSYGLVHPYSRVKKFLWRNGQPPAGRENQPVVLVNYADAKAYADWLSINTGENWRLPDIDEWERAARGDNGRMFPWGEAYSPALLNSHDNGPFDTLPVGSFEADISPHGLYDAAGQVFEWMLSDNTQQRSWVKGGSWDDKGCGVCRPAARHSRPKNLKHILIGFRLVRDAG